MTFDFTAQEHQYLLQVLAQRPVAEALPMILKLTGQQLVPSQSSGPPPLAAVS